MAVFTIQAPDGRKIKIEAGDEATAIRGAQEWAAQNPAAVKLQGKPTRDVPFGAAGPSDNVEGLGAQGSYDFAVGRVADRYFPGADKAKVAAEFAPYDAGKLFNAGLTMGFNDEAAGAGAALGDLLTGRTSDFGQAYADYTALERARQQLGQAQQGTVGTAAEIGGALMSGRPDVAAARVSGLIPTMVQGAKGGALGGGVYGFASADGDLADRAKGAVTGATTGAAFGAAVPLAVAGAKRLISPSNAPAGTRSAAQVLQREGVDLTAGQATGNQNLRFREAELGGAKAADFMDKQAEQFTAAALKRAGISAPRATHDVIDTGFANIGQQFDDLAARNQIEPDRAMLKKLSDVWSNYKSVTNESTRMPAIQALISDIMGKAQNTSAPSLQIVLQNIDGAWYKATRSMLGKWSKHSNPEFAEAARDIMSVLDDAMERTIRKTNPGDLGAWQEARRLYKNMLVIEDAATRAGADSAEGLITPQALRSAAIRQNKRAFARGRNDFVELADAGATVMTPLPNSGTPGRLNARSVLPIGMATGAGLGGTVGGVPGAVIGGVAGAAAPWLAGRTLLSAPVRGYLTNQVASGPVGGLAALLGSEFGKGVQPLLPAK